MNAHSLFLSTIAIPVMFGTLATKSFAADIVVLSTFAARPVIDKVQAEFERTTKHRLLIKYDTAAALKTEIEAGRPSDVFLLTRGASTALEKSGKVPANSAQRFAIVLLGLAAKEGQVTPRIESRQSFEETLLAADKISYVKDGASGQTFIGLLEKNGMHDRLREKLMPMSAAETVEAAASGHVTYAVQLVSEIVSVSGAKLVGAFPSEYQLPAELTVGCSNDPCSQGGRTLVRFLTSDQINNAIKTSGMER